MGKSSPQLPPTPDPNALINAQADANRITQYTPQGNLRFGYVGGQGQFVEGRGGDDTQSAAFTQETPFQTQMRAAQEGTGLGLGNVAFNRVSGQTVVGQNPDGSPIFANDPNFSNPFQTAPTLGRGQDSHKTLTQQQACQPLQVKLAPRSKCRQPWTQQGF
jgi:hypothetical protein